VFRITSATFGNQPGCDVVYVLFVIDTPALRSGRIVGLTFTSLLTASYLLITSHEIRSYLIHEKRSGSNAPLPSNVDSVIPEPKKYSSRRTTAMTDTTTATTTVSSSTAAPNQSRRSSLPLSVTSSDSPNIKSTTNKPVLGSQTRHPSLADSSAASRIGPSNLGQRRRPKRRSWFVDFDPMLLGITICQALVFGYFIVSSELLRVRNHSAGQADGQWAFGQILALITIAPSLVSLIRAFKEHGFKRTHRRKGNRRRRKRATDVV